MEEVYNKEKTQILENYDLELGKLVNDTLEVVIPEVQAVEEEYHYETVATYENGGKDVKKVIDVEGVKYQREKTIQKNILVYVPFSEKELKQRKIMELENWFNNYFDRMLTQSLWQTDFSVSPDPYFVDAEGKALTYQNIGELKIKAESVRSEIKTLRALIG